MAMEVKPDETAKAIVPVLACVLNQLCLRNDRLPVNQRAVSKFHALRPPAISIRDYLSRIAKYAACSGECFVLALVYIDRIIQSNPSFVVNSLNIHRLLITSVMLAAKFFDDQYFNNAYYAKVGGVPCPEVNSLEVEFLFMTNFTLFVATDTYRQYYTELCNHATNSTCGCASQQIPKLVIPPGPAQLYRGLPPPDMSEPWTESEPVSAIANPPAPSPTSSSSSSVANTPATTAALPGSTASTVAPSRGGNSSHPNSRPSSSNGGNYSQHSQQHTHTHSHAHGGGHPHTGHPQHPLQPQQQQQQQQAAHHYHSSGGNHAMAPPQPQQYAKAYYVPSSQPQPQPQQPLQGLPQSTVRHTNAATANTTNGHPSVPLVSYAHIVRPHQQVAQQQQARASLHNVSAGSPPVTSY